MTAVSLILRSLQKFFTSQTFFNIGFCVKYLNPRSCFNLSFFKLFTRFLFYCCCLPLTTVADPRLALYTASPRVPEFWNTETSTACQRMMRNSGGKCSKRDPPPLKGVGVHGLFITLFY